MADAIAAIDPSVIEVDDERSIGDPMAGIELVGAVQDGATSGDVSENIIDVGVPMELTLPSGAELGVGQTSPRDTDLVASGVELAMATDLLEDENGELRSSSSSETNVFIELSVTDPTEAIGRYTNAADLAADYDFAEARVTVQTTNAQEDAAGYRLSLESPIQDRTELETFFAIIDREYDLSGPLPGLSSADITLYGDEVAPRIRLTIPEFNSRDEDEAKTLYVELAAVTAVRLHISTSDQSDVLVLE